MLVTSEKRTTPVPSTSIALNMRLKSDSFESNEAAAADRFCDSIVLRSLLVEAFLADSAAAR